MYTPAILSRPIRLPDRAVERHFMKRGLSGPYNVSVSILGGYRVLKCDVIILNTSAIRTFEPHRAIHTAAVRTWAKFQIVILNESEDRED